MNPLLYIFLLLLAIIFMAVVFDYALYQLVPFWWSEPKLTNTILTWINEIIIEPLRQLIEGIANAFVQGFTTFTSVNYNIIGWLVLITLIIGGIYLWLRK